MTRPNSSATPAGPAVLGGRAGEFLWAPTPSAWDMLSRLIYGAQYSLFIGIVVVAIALTGGIVIGLVAGFYGGWVDNVIMRVMERGLFRRCCWRWCWSPFWARA